MEDIELIVRPLVESTYGKSGYVDDLIECLARRIKDIESPRERERTIMMVCWDWMAGGTTAQNLAIRIEKALEAR